MQPGLALNLLLGLMTLSMQGKADERVWAEHIRRVLHPVGGYARPTVA